MLTPGGMWALPQRGGDTRGALARPVVPPGTCLGSQLQLVDGGYALGLLQAPPGLGGAGDPGSPRGLAPRSWPLRLPLSRKGGGLRGGWRGCSGDPAPQPHGAQRLPPAGELLHHLAIAGGLCVTPAPRQPLAPPARATGSPRFIRQHPGCLSTPCPWARGWVALPGALGSLPASTSLAPPGNTGRRGGGAAASQPGFAGGFNAAVLFRRLAAGISG